MKRAPGEKLPEGKLKLSCGGSQLHERLSAILDEYLTLLESGAAIDDERFLAKHAAFATQLRPHLNNLRAMQIAVGPASSVDDQPFASAYEAPQKLGAYVLVREIGRGGQGIVYEAHDETLNRRVALKVLPFASVLDRKQIDRFNNEAQAAARLHHPNIVPVYAVGVDRGVHYYAMQFIEGAPLSVAIQQLAAEQSPVAEDASTVRQESTVAHKTVSSWMKPNTDPSGNYAINTRHFEQVARLGIELADGLSHAHELGIVHRDIKPSNLLLDENGKSWITDFGLARVPNDSSMTGTGDILGTVRYMSPEQARGRHAFVDHRTDIYSLGVTLYELLTLQPAFGSSSREEFMLEVGNQPPTRLRRINTSIPPDLENIILRAIEPEPSDRYESAAQFSDDLQRYLDGRPTLAKRAAISDRVFKWARRHRRMVTTAAACLILLAAGLATATFLIAREQSKTAAALEEEKVSTRKANANFAAARDMVDQLGVQTSEALAGIPGTEKVRRDLLTKTKGYHDFLLAQSRDESLLHDRGVTLTRSARITEQLGEIDEALKLYNDAEKELEATLASDPANDVNRSELLNCRNNLAMLLGRTGRLEEATDKLQLAVSQQQELLKDSPDNSRLVFDLACSQSNLAFLYERAGQRKQSRSAYESAIRRYRESNSDTVASKQRRQFALVMHNLSALLAHDDHAQAYALCNEAISLQRKCMKQDPSVGLMSELAISLDRLAELHTIKRAFGDAEKAYLDAIAIQRKLISASPHNIGLRENLAITLNHLGDMFRETESFAAAEQSFAEAAELLTAMVDMAPQQVAFRSSLGAVLYNRGSVLMELDDQSAALDLWKEGLSHQQAAVKQAPTIKSFRTFLDRQKTSLQEAFPEHQ